jgi:3-deoxy-7-phosphoheptulonate synthase
LKPPVHTTGGFFLPFCDSLFFQEHLMTLVANSTVDAWYPPGTQPVDRTSQTDDERIKDITVLPPPEHLIRFFPIRGTPIESLIANTRSNIGRIMAGTDDRLLVVIGPCSIHDPAAAVEYARRLKEQRTKYADTLEIVMRVYFEKPRTTVGWKGLINDPYLDESYRIDEGLRMARQLLIEINRLGLPAGSEFLDVISPQYIGDLIAWGAIGARTTESQVHRELASGLSAPIGFKNGTDGNIKIATDAIQAAARGHHFLSVHKNGQVAVVQTNGNKDCHAILRGGKAPNYDAASVTAACKDLSVAGLPPTLMVDCSHANSSKQHERQSEVARDIAQQVAGGSRQVFGVMVESHLQDGTQKFSPGKDNPQNLRYGQSITDACLGWEASVEVLETLSKGVLQRRKSAV